MPDLGAIAFVAAVALLPLLAGGAAIVLLLRRRLRALRDELVLSCRRDGETVAAGPASASCAGATADGPARGNGILAVTERRLLFRGAAGNDVEADLGRVRGAEVRPTFRGQVALGTGALFLVLSLADGSELGFLVRDAATFARAVRNRAGG